MTDLYGKLGEVEMDNLLTDITPKAETRGKTIRKLEAASILKRGTILAMSSGEGGDGKLVVLGTEAGKNETLTPDCVLCDDTTVDDTADVEAIVYTAGCFNTSRVTVKEDYEMTAADFDALRKYGIVFKAAAE